ncbi:hypothetical protein F5Y11DRAFT_363239 [Daldinia sp. FL1419]|nr:hypothetical protein F5Y11DRAFT_363239 [Daldinia sp. FL1419]
MVSAYMLSAKELRQCCGEPEPREPKDSHILEDAAAWIGGIIRRKRQDPVSPADLPRETRGSIFDNLPYDAKAHIFEMVGSSPSWVYFKFNKGTLTEFWGGSQEIYINREWYESRQLRQGLSIISPSRQPPGIEILVERFLRLFSGGRSSSDSAEASQPQHILTREQVDWFLYDNLVERTPNTENWRTPFYLHNVRVCVFKLDNMYDGMFDASTENLHPEFIWPRYSRVEELVILVGRFRKEVPPSRMRVVKTFQVDQLTEEDTCAPLGNVNHEEYLYESEKIMIEFISNNWAEALLARNDLRQTWLSEQDGLQWLAYPVHDDENELSLWLASREGYTWLGHNWNASSKPGYQFLASQSGWWWLASKLGFPWLETEQGLRWLETPIGRRFLQSKQALLWANTGSYTPSSLTPLGTQVRKAWFNTNAGRQWKFQNCPNGNPPTPPSSPQRQLIPPPDTELPSFFINPHFQGWRFVICPEELNERSQARRT